MSNYLKNLFNTMKGLGMWPQYESYEAFSKKELHLKEIVPPERDIPKELGLDDKETEEYNGVFGCG